MAGLLGLDYNALFKIMDVYAIKDQQAVFDDVRTMELAALAVFNKADSA